jgi:hypothetical protein
MPKVHQRNAGGASGGAMDSSVSRIVGAPSVLVPGVVILFDGRVQREASHTITGLYLRCDAAPFITLRQRAMAP